MVKKRRSTRGALRGYLQTVMNRFPDNREICDEITKLLKDLRLGRVRSTNNDVISKVSQLFKGHKDLLLGLNKFLPPGYKITLPKDQTQRGNPEFRDAMKFLYKVEVLYALRDHQDLRVDFAAFLPARYR
ncbi:Paired amphipathic helix (PAH2) superfamily protein [Raphanus sativus]|uniref:Paired amphipathic helix protein Sin3-like 5 n=1 Tax=Raphanus sativus TaxID=3726 RepID=A0A6J0LMI9_RAPSA|nr:paired amphipathic helix protein Sin3-like 5 [Raphanus sativus]KAJ4909618.1 Paired amphipathic helix (PAH2) superfamily protein [Raphanus sativus]